MPIARTIASGFSASLLVLSSPVAGAENAARPGEDVRHRSPAIDVAGGLRASAAHRGATVPHGVSAPPANAPSQGAQVREVFFAGHEATACQPGRREFVLDDLRGLYVCVVWAGLAGTHYQQLTFLSPDGHVYQMMTHAFVTPEAPARGATVEVEERHHEVKRAGWGRAGETTVVAALPVAGTYITQHNLEGSWTVQISVDGRPVDQDTFVLHARQ